jgi:hypothetical protein
MNLRIGKSTAAADETADKFNLFYVTFGVQPGQDGNGEAILVGLKGAEIARQQVG